jgi:hypothetical protein
VTEVLEALFHWSPTERRKLIRERGLHPFKRPVIHSQDNLGYPYVSLSPTPSAGWSLSGAIVDEIDEWDLWMVRLADTDAIHVRSDFGPVIQEVKVSNVIPPDRLWYVGTRMQPVAEEFS